MDDQNRDAAAMTHAVLEQHAELQERLRSLMTAQAEVIQRWAVAYQPLIDAADRIRKLIAAVTKLALDPG